MTAASVVEGPSIFPLQFKGRSKKSNVYRMPAKLICFTVAEARADNGPSLALNVPEPYRASSVSENIPTKKTIDDYTGGGG